MSAVKFKGSLLLTCQKVGMSPAVIYIRLKYENGQKSPAIHMIATRKNQQLLDAARQGEDITITAIKRDRRWWQLNPV